MTTVHPAAVRPSRRGSRAHEPSPHRGDEGTRFPRWFAIAVFVLSTGAFFAVNEAAPEGQSQPLVLLLWALAYVVAGIAVFDGALRHRRRVSLPIALTVTLGLTALSVLWSVDPTLTLRRSVGLVGTALVGLYIAQRLSPVETLDALRRALLLVAIASLLFYASGDPAARDEIHDTLRGVVATKNTLGRLMALGLLASAATALLDPGRIRRCIASALPMVVALVLTDSTGGSLVAAAVVACMMGAALWRAAPGRIMLGGAVALALGVIAMLLPRATPERVTGLVGEDASLTGRTDIWELSLTAVQDRPWLGYGYGAFWDGSETAERISSRLQWNVPNAHSGWLDLALELGVLGVLLAVLVMGTLVVQGVRDLASGRGDRATLRLAVAGVIGVTNLTESGLLQQNVLLTVLLAAAIAVRPGETLPVSRAAAPR